ncbi:MAG: 6-bladed beta-propeller [Gemmatimonadaceae bacterium]|nr:6-bladed beta-propeller [Gemmatimonadaceae bacterium]
MEITMPFRRISALIVFAAPLLLGAQTTPRWIIGGEDDAVTQLGRVRAVVALSRSFVVLERDAPFLKVFDYSGRLLQTLGRSGAGPGEYRGPTSLSFDERNQRLLVVDPSNARVTAYQVRDSLVAPRFLKVGDSGIRSVCALGTRLIGLARNAPTILRELREEGGKLTVTGSFGEPRTNHPLGTHPMVRTRASDGPLLCDEQGNRVIVASAMLGEVHVFDASSRQLVTTPIPGFQRITMIVEDSALTMVPPVGGYHVVHGLVPWEGSVRVVTERLRPMPGDAPMSVGFAFAGIGAGGPGALGARTQWRPLAKTSSGALCAQEDPAPAIALFTAGSCP